MEITKAKKEHLNKSINELLFLLDHVRSQLKDDKITDREKSTYMSLLESKTSDLMKGFDYDCDLRKEEESRSIALKTANDRIYDLEKQLGGKVTDTDVVMGADRIAEEIKEWWKSLGFYTFSDISITDNKNIEVTLNIQVNEEATSWLSGDDPDEHARMKEEDTKHLENMKLIYDIDDKREVLDNDKNRNKIFAHITEKYPRAIFSQYSTRMSAKGPQYMDKIKFYIPFYNYQLSMRLG